jgi:hypothetical protein
MQSIEGLIEERFFQRAADLLKDPAWARYRTEMYGIHGPKLAIAEFTERYTALLAWAFVEYVEMLCKALMASNERITWTEAEKRAFHYVERFVKGSYHHPWTGDFLLARKEYRQDFRRLHESAPWFSDALFIIWQQTFYTAIGSGDWKQRAAEDAKQRVRVTEATTQPAKKNRRSSAAGDDEVPIPLLWVEIQQRGSITLTQAAQFLRCDERTVRRLVKQNELASSKSSRIVCNEKLRHQIQKKHGPHVVR